MGGGGGAITYRSFHPQPLVWGSGRPASSGLAFQDPFLAVVVEPTCQASRGWRTIAVPRANARRRRAPSGLPFSAGLATPRGGGRGDVVLVAQCLRAQRRAGNFLSGAKLSGAALSIEQAGPRPRATRTHGALPQRLGVLTLGPRAFEAGGDGQRGAGGVPRNEACLSPSARLR